MKNSANKPAQSDSTDKKLVSRVVNDPELLNKVLLQLDLQQVSVTRVSHSIRGPIPDSSELEKYEKILPGAADRIISMAEKQQEHNHTINNKAVTGAIWKDRIAQILAFLCVCIVSGVAIDMISHDQPLAAASVMTGVLVALAGVFLYSRKAGGERANNND